MSVPSAVPHLLPDLLRDDALVDRNAGWKGHSLVPRWVDLENVGLDAFFTRPEIARDCYESLLAWMRDDGAVPEAYSFIEPSAGTGAFYGLLPEARRVGVDLIPYRPEYEVADFLSWSPQRSGTKWAVVGNPPFGHRSWLALAFVNHAATFADYLGMILPMSFQSDGKGSPKHRVRGLRLLHTDYLPADAFTDGNTATSQPTTAATSACSTSGPCSPTPDWSMTSRTAHAILREILREHPVAWESHPAKSCSTLGRRRMSRQAGPGVSSPWRRVPTHPTSSRSVPTG